MVITLKSIVNHRRSVGFIIKLTFHNDISIYGAPGLQKDRQLQTSLQCRVNVVWRWPVTEATFSFRTGSYESPQARTFNFLNRNNNFSISKIDAACIRFINRVWVAAITIHVPCWPIPGRCHGYNRDGGCWHGTFVKGVVTLRSI